MTRQITVALVTLMMLGSGRASAQAQEPPAPHVRTDSADVRALIDEGVRRSPTIRALVARLDQSDVIAYVRIRELPHQQLDGRLSFVTLSSGRRYVVVELSCERPHQVQLAALGHELGHAVEIAGAPEVTSSSTLAEFYTRTGMRQGTASEKTFETAGAISVGRQVHHDLVAPPRRANGM